MGIRELHGQSLRFEDRSASAGLSTAPGTNGVAVADFDQNGTADIFFAVMGGGSALFSGHGDGTFTEVTVQAGIQTAGNAAAPVWADVNNDGFPDLFVGKRGGSHPNRLFLNGGDGTFADLLPDSGIDPDASVGSAAFGDFDNDGLIDLFVAVRGGPDLLYRNLDELRFEDVTEQFGVEGLEGSVAMQSSWFDYDSDGDVDLLAVHDGTFPNRLHVNYDGLYFQEAASQVGLDDVGSGNGMGLTWIDADLDGRTDLYVTRIFEASLYHNQGGNRFEDRAEPFGVVENGMSWGVVSEDFDNDADPDLFIVNTYSYDNDSETFLYSNEDGIFENVAREAGAALKMDAFGVASADFNRDGLRDLVIANTAGENRLLINRTDAAGNWISIELKGENANRMAIGATVRVKTDGLVQRRTVFAGESYCSQSSSTLHFGLAGAAFVDAVEISWPGTDSVDKYVDLAANRHYMITEGDGIAVAAVTEVPADLELGLGMPFPNPFSKSTTLEVSLPELATASVAVFDLLGRRINVLDVGEMPAGKYPLTWNGTDATGRLVPAGVYLVRFDAGGRSLTRRIVRVE